MRVFLSCVSAEFRSYRLRLANQLGALKGSPYDVKVQEDFRQGGDTLLDKLADYVRDCDLVIHLVGDASGARPTPAHERTLLRHLDERDDVPLPGWSYTRWEYQLARRFNRRVLVYVAHADATRDCGLPVSQRDEDALLQQAHVAAVHDSGQHSKTIGNSADFVREVFFDLGLEPSRKANNLPLHSLGTLFKGREGFLEQIHEALGVATHRGHQRVAAITAAATAATVYGLGGMGKTRAAIEYAHRRADDYTALLFVRADSPEGLKANLAALCGPLVLDLAEKNVLDLDEQVAASTHWLQQHPGWLLIVDNVDDETAAQAVEDLLGQLTSAGQVLITSRLSRWSGAVATLDLDVLSVEDAASFLLERTDTTRRAAIDDEEQARELAVTLGQLALGLEQAGAYVAHHRLTFAQYLTAWRDRHDRVLAWFDPRVMRYPASVAITWQTSFDRLSEPARQLLQRLAWFAPDPIPEFLLDVAAQAFEPDMRDALAELDAHSLVTRDDAARFSVHRLLQDVTRSSQVTSGDTETLSSAVNWMAAAFVDDPSDVRTWPRLEPLAPHALVCARHADEAGITAAVGMLFNRLGLLFATKVQPTDAEPLYRRALAIDEHTHGPDDPEVAGSLNNLAELFRATSRLSEAEPLYRRALAIYQLSLGPGDPKVAIGLNNLAELLRETSRLDEAEPLTRRALAIFEHCHGPVHPMVGICLNNLAEMLRATNRVTEAEPLSRRALAIDERNYGPDHPTVARDLNNLAGLFETMNRMAEAEPLFRRALAIDERAFGPDHPSVAGRLNNLAGVLVSTRRLAEAEPLYRRALAIHERSYGSDHPRVAGVLNNLAMLLDATNRTAEAEPLCRRALAIDERAFGPDHPTVATDVDNLAEVLHSLNRLTEVEPLRRRALAIDERSYGPDHPMVATRLNNLAGYLSSTGRLAEAEPLNRRCLVILVQFTRTTGYRHQHLQAAADHYARVLQAMGLSRDQILAKLREIAPELW